MASSMAAFKNCFFPAHHAIASSDTVLQKWSIVSFRALFFVTVVKSADRIYCSMKDVNSSSEGNVGFSSGLFNWANGTSSRSLASSSDTVSFDSDVVWRGLDVLAFFVGDESVLATGLRLLAVFPYSLPSLSCSEAESSSVSSSWFSSLSSTVWTVAGAATRGLAGDDFFPTGRYQSMKKNKLNNQINCKKQNIFISTK